MPPGVVFNFRGQPWRLIMTERLAGDARGIARPRRSGHGGTIRVRPSLQDAEALEVLIHEAIHACHWDLAEEAVDETARDIAVMLWNLGYRRVPAHG